MTELHRSVSSEKEYRVSISFDRATVAALVDAEKQVLLERLQAILAIDTCIPPGRNYDKVVDLIEPQFQQYGLHTERVIIPEELIKAMPQTAP
jgi:hypothetical protein